MFCNFLNASGDTYVSCWTSPNFIPSHIRFERNMLDNLFTEYIIANSYEFFLLKNYLKNYTLENCKRIFDAQYFNESPSFKIPPQHFHESNFCWWVEKLTFYF